VGLCLPPDKWRFLASTIAREFGNEDRGGDDGSEG
jgi:hypothetical protein